MPRDRGLVPALMAFALPVAAQEAAEPIIRIDNPAAVALALRDQGYRAKLSTTDAGRPMIESGTSGILFDMQFFFCDAAGAACEGLMFTSGFDLRNGIGLDLMNKWNRERLVGRAYTNNDCDPTLDYFLTIDSNLNEKDFALLLADWDRALTDFRDFIGFDDDEISVTADCLGNDAT